MQTQIPSRESYNNRFETKSDVNTQKHYKGSTSIYNVAEDFDLNSYEFDIIKRILRCRHKGSWLQDLQKTKDTIDIYIKEQQDKFGKL
jgi:hypothetical protein